MAQSNFWGRAKDSNSNIIELPENQDPQVPIIPKEEALRIVDASIPVGLAMSCNVKWSRYYLRFMSTEREKDVWSETQIAFIGLLFGVSQQNIFQMFNGSCTHERRIQLEQQMGNEGDT